MEKAAWGSAPKARAEVQVQVQMAQCWREGVIRQRYASHLEGLLFPGASCRGAAALAWQRTMANGREFGLASGARPGRA